MHLTSEEMNFLESELDSTFGHLMSRSELTPWDLIAPPLINPDSSSGYPFQQCGMQTKGEVFEHFSAEELYTFFKEYPSMVGCSLKDELRPKGKDARLFLPAPAHAVVAGVRLFKSQNELLAGDPLHLPIAATIRTPGLTLAKIWLMMYLRGGCSSGDGSGFDARFPLSIMQLICRWRAKYLPEESRADCLRYYEQVYLGYKDAFGTQVQLIGNSSGHYNTTMDNSLCSCCMMFLYQRNVKRKVEFKVCGDDLLSSPLDPEVFLRTADQLGMHYELTIDSDVFKHTFLGTHPIGFPIRYSYNELKLASHLVWLPNFKLADLVDRLVSYYQLTFYSPLAPFFRAALEVEISKLPPIEADLKRSCVNPIKIDRLYNSWETGTPCGQGAF